MPADERLRGDVELLSGRAPATAHEVAIDATSAEDHDIALGSTIKVLFQGPTQEFTVVGTVGFGDEKDLGGTTSAYFDTATAQRVLGTPGIFDSIDVSAEPGVAPGRARRPAERGRPRRHRGRHRRARWRRRTPTRSRRTSSSSSILFMVFAGIALFVGSFIIWNTFTMIVTQRSREIALLRAIGATPPPGARAACCSRRSCSAPAPPPSASGWASASRRG